MNLDFITQKDFTQFKLEFLKMAKETLSKSQNFKKEILTNQDVKDLLGISSTTLRKYRITGKITYSKVDNILYYKYNDVIKFIESYSMNSLDRK
jgi:hypothetical protein